MLKRIIPLLWLLAGLGACRTASVQTSDASALQLQAKEGTFLSIDSTLQADPKVEKMVAAFRVPLQEKMNTVLAYAASDLYKQDPEGPLGNFVSDLCLAQARKLSTRPVDACLLNKRGLRAPIAKGPIKVQDVFALMPFENELVVIDLTGAEMQRMVEYIAKAKGMPVAGLRMGIKDGKPVEVEIGGQPLDLSRTYRVATSDYLQQGGDNMSFFSKGAVETFQKPLRDAIIDYLDEQDTVRAKADGRIRLLN